MGLQAGAEPTYAYNHGGARSLGWQQYAALAFFSVGAIAGGLISAPFFLGLLAVPFVFATAPRVVYVGARYFICGRLIVYYANVSRLVLDQPGGELRLESGPLVFTLLSERFPTNAQKPGKIALNQALKFQRVARKLVERVRAAAPRATLEGVKP